MSKLKKVGGQYIIDDPSLRLTDMMALDYGEVFDVTVHVVDKRIISPQQRKFIFALCSEVSYFTGEDKEYIRALMQQYNSNIRNYPVESLSSCSMTYANDLIDTIITFALEQEIPLSKSILDKNEYSFSEKQVYTMCLKRVCVVCGRRAELHHVDTVGMGQNRNKIDHKGKRMLPLCREHHNETHTIGDTEFIEKYHLATIVIDEKLEYFIKRGIVKVFDEKER